MNRRFEKTQIDQLIIVLNPVLIMILIGTLLLFLLEVFYQGQFDERLRFILLAFVMAIVLVARIAADQGRQYSLMYAAPLGLVTLIAILRFITFQGPLASVSGLINACLMIAVWWVADRLTWDCTIADESRDPSGEGLLMNIGWDQEQESTPPEVPANSRENPTTPAVNPATLWRSMFPRRREHKPGMWVLFFSLAALPLFGIGQIFASSNSLASRRYLFQLLFLYVVSAFGLLLTTSLLGLRRYLSTRRVQMPDSMALVWLGSGSIMIVVLMAFCMMLPRRHPEYSITHPFTSAEETTYRKSRNAVGRDGKKEDRNADRVGRDTPREAAEDGNPGQSSKKSPDSSDRSSAEASAREQSKANGNSKDDQALDAQAPPKDDSTDRRRSEKKSPKSEQRKSEQRKPPSRAENRDRRSADKSPRSAPQPASRSTSTFSGLARFLANVLKFVYYVVIILGVIYVLWRYHTQLRTILTQFVESLRSFWSRLWSGRQNEREQEPLSTFEEQPSEQLPPFSDFSNPFSSGQSNDRSMDQLVAYSFDALEAWGRDHGCPRNAQQTPREYALQIGRSREGLSVDAHNLAHLYSLAAYARGSLPSESRDHVQKFWETLGRCQDEEAIAEQGIAPQG